MEARRLRWFVAIQFAIPTSMLLARVIAGKVVGYGWGWQMFS